MRAISIGEPSTESMRGRLPRASRACRAGVSALALIAATLEIIPAFASAQDAVAPTTPDATATPNPQDDPSSRVEDIVVTAERRQENLQRVPVTVTAVTAMTLERANINTATSLQQVTPGLTFSSFGRSAFPYIRGIGTPDNSVGNESSVATYVDGIYIESTPAALLELNNIERIEVLKGPQGTLFGRNATGGLIQIITRRPSQTTTGNLEVGYGNYQTVRTTGYLTGALAKNLSADVAMVYSNQNEGWGRNVTLGRDVNIGRSFSVRSKVMLELPTTTVTLGGDYTYQGTDIGLSRNLFPGTLGRTTSPPAPPRPIAPLPGFYDSQSNLFPFTTTRTGGVNLRVEQDFDFAKLISISSYRKTKLLTAFDTDETPASVLEITIDQRVRAFTQEVQLASQGKGAFRWIVGAFYMNREGRQPGLTLTGSSLPPFFGGRSVVRSDVRTETFAPFAQGTLRMGTGTEITAGGRYTVERQRFRGTQETATGRITSPVPPVPRVTYKEPTWRLALNQQFSERVMAYVSYNRGFKSGVYNTNTAADPPVDPEIVDAYEVGFKSELFDRRVRFNAAAYQSNYKDIQLNVATGNPAAPTRSLNAARARIRGVEASIDAVPARGLTLTVGVNYMPTAKYLEFPGAPFFQPDPVYGANRPPLSIDNSGARMIRAPEFTGTVSASYTFDVASGELDLGVNLYRSSAFLWNVDNVDRPDLPVPHFRKRYQQSAYSTLNGQIAYRDESGVMVAVWARNLLDKKYYSSVSEVGTGDVYSPAAPRTYGVRVGYSF